MMLDAHWVFVGAALGMVGSLCYAVAIVRGDVRPNLVTWGLWAAAPLIGFFAQLDSGVGLPAVMTLAAGGGPLVVVVTSVVAGRHYARLGVFDVACAGVAVAAVVVWVGLGDASSAVFFAVAADAIAALPTIRKAWRDPDSENALFYGLVAVGASVTLLSIEAWTPQAGAFAVYQLCVCVLLVAVIAARRRTRRVPTGRRAASSR